MFAETAGWLTWQGLIIVTLASATGGLLLLRRHRQHVRRFMEHVVPWAKEPNTQTGLPPWPVGSLIDGALTGSVIEAIRTGQREHQGLAASDAGKEAVLATIPYPLLTLTAERRVTRANPAAQEIFEGHIEGSDLISVLREPTLLSAAEAILDGAESRTVEFTIAGVRIQHLVARIQRLPFALPDGTIAVLALQDVTALKRAEQLRADFVANASHELKTPLASLMGFIETLGGPARDDAEARDRFLPIMAEQSVRMAHLVEDLLSLSRIEMHEHMTPQDVVDIAALLRRVTAALSLKAEDRDVTLAIEIEKDGPLLALGDEEELLQVFQNLVDNAIKYGRSHSEVTLRARGPHGDSGRGIHPSLQVSVIDSGEGIPREHIPRLTERFYRVDKARSRALGGTGLGLAIVKHIVNRHRGRLEIRSEPGQGSVFTVQLRAAQAALRPLDRSPKRPKPVAPGKEPNLDIAAG
ncbi:MAG: hypothetical protein GDA41_04190 [Rhodospirillales bacterium]|nr:hypothetical protein [Rhodospirillales bacterium]